jgi:hypothetical protein
LYLSHTWIASIFPNPKRYVIKFIFSWSDLLLLHTSNMDGSSLDISHGSHGSITGRVFICWFQRDLVPSPFPRSKIGKYAYLTADLLTKWKSGKPHEQNTLKRKIKPWKEGPNRIHVHNPNVLDQNYMSVRCTLWDYCFSFKERNQGTICKTKRGVLTRKRNNRGWLLQNNCTNLKAKQEKLKAGISPGPPRVM